MRKLLIGKKRKPVQVCEEAHHAAVSHIKPKGILSKWIEEAIYEKIDREKLMFAPTLERQ